MVEDDYKVTAPKGEVRGSRIGGYVLPVVFGVFLGGCVMSESESPSRRAEGSDGERTRENLSATEFPFDEMRSEAGDDTARRAVDACRRGVAEDCFRLGVFYHGGDGVPRNNDRSNRLIRHACRSGHTRACYSWAVRRYRGLETEQDVERARALFERACSDEMWEGCHMLSRVVRRGLGGPRSPERARWLARRSCELGGDRDCDRLDGPLRAAVGAHEERLPKGAPESVVRAARRCDSGLMSGCTRLGNAYETGDGVPEDIARAERLFELACDWGELRACRSFRAMQGTAIRFEWTRPFAAESASVEEPAAR